MPKFKLETSLYEPVTVEVEGGRTFTSVPLSPQLIRGIQAIEDEARGSTPLRALESVTRQVALIFGVGPEEIESVDVRILQRVLEIATEAMTRNAASLKVPTTVPPDEPVDKATAEKNGSRPEGETLQ